MTEVEKEAEELERIEDYLNSIATSEKGIQRVIQTVIKQHTEIVLAEIIKYEEHNKPELMAVFKLAVKIWARG